MIPWPQALWNDLCGLLLDQDPVSQSPVSPWPQALWSLADRSYAGVARGADGDAGAATEATRQLRSAMAVLSMAATQRPQTVLDNLDLLLKVSALFRV